jgi:hypothetical protein
MADISSASEKLKTYVSNYLAEKAPQKCAKLLTPDFGGIDKQTGIANHSQAMDDNETIYLGLTDEKRLCMTGR